MINIIFFSALAIISVGARPSGDFDPQNVVTVPPNCPPGQQWINGQCRDVWPLRDIGPNNVVTVPPNCPAGQQFINGQCRDVWRIQGLDTQAEDESRSINNHNVVTVPPNCKPGQQWINGQCRDVWPSNVIVPPWYFSRQEYVDESFKETLNTQYSVLVSKILAALSNNSENVEELILFQDDNERNIINVPNQCPAGFRPDALGICREIFD